MMIAYLNLEAEEQAAAVEEAKTTQGPGDGKTINAVEAFEARRRAWFEEQGITERE